MSDTPKFAAAPKPKRFYTAAEVVEHGEKFGIALDKRPVRTPGKALLSVADRRLAQAMAAEWEAQRDVIDAATMPLTRIVNTAIDGVTGREDEIRD
ncbi:MAG: ATPase, partial [Hyphomicrobiaceae bacterium]|nr:ATPase [Hyphomicrobiaceae bacterium]